jgi:hypothetical protein
MNTFHSIHMGIKICARFKYFVTNIQIKRALMHPYLLTN